RNRATAVFFAGIRLSQSGRDAELRLDDSYRFEDRRLGLGVTVERDAAEELLQGLAEGAVVAIRGDDLALVRSSFTLPGSAFTSDNHAVLGVGENGVTNLSLVFELDDLPAALLELDERY